MMKQRRRGEKSGGGGGEERKKEREREREKTEQNLEATYIVPLTTCFVNLCAVFFYFVSFNNDTDNAWREVGHMNLSLRLRHRTRFPDWDSDAEMQDAYLRKHDATLKRLTFLYRRRKPLTAPFSIDWLASFANRVVPLF